MLFIRNGGKSKGSITLYAVLVSVFSHLIVKGFRTIMISRHGSTVITNKTRNHKTQKEITCIVSSLEASSNCIIQSVVIVGNMHMTRIACFNSKRPLLLCISALISTTKGKFVSAKGINIRTNFVSILAC